MRTYLDLVLLAVSWVTWVGATSGIIKLDAKRQAALAAARGEEDFKDRSPTTYLVLAVLLGPLPLVVYFISTRRGVKGWALGFGAAFAVFALTSLIGGAVRLAVVPSVVDEMPSLAPTFVLPAAAPSDVSSLDERIAMPFMPGLRETAKKATPTCDDPRSHPPIHRQPSPAKGTALDGDPNVVQVEVWCMSGDAGLAFPNLRPLPDGEPGWQRGRYAFFDPETKAQVKITVESPTRAGTNEVRYRLGRVEVRVEVRADVRPR